MSDADTSHNFLNQCSNDDSLPSGPGHIETLDSTLSNNQKQNKNIDRVIFNPDHVGQRTDGDRLDPSVSKSFIDDVNSRHAPAVVPAVLKYKQTFNSSNSCGTDANICSIKDSTGATARQKGTTRKVTWADYSSGFGRLVQYQDPDDLDADMLANLVYYLEHDLVRKAKHDYEFGETADEGSATSQ